MFMVNTSDRNRNGLRPAQRPLPGGLQAIHCRVDHHPVIESSNDQSRRGQFAIMRTARDHDRAGRGASRRERPKRHSRHSGVTSSRNRVGDSEKSKTSVGRGVDRRAAPTLSVDVGAEPAGDRHLGQRDGQPAFAQSRDSFARGRGESRAWRARTAPAQRRDRPGGRGPRPADRASAQSEPPSSRRVIPRSKR